MNIPVLDKYHVHISQHERKSILIRSNQLLADDKKLQNYQSIGALIRTGLCEGPNLYIEDHQWIRLFEHAGDKSYSYRSLLLADDGDQVIVGGQRCYAFEKYCQQTLDLGYPEILTPNKQTRSEVLSLTSRCLNDNGLIAKIVERTRQAGALNIIPYMNTTATWHLAYLIAELSGVSVRIASPPPRLTRCVNDKAWFARRVVEILGASSEPVSSEAFNLATLSLDLSRLARTFSKVAIKLTDSASSAGNIVMDATELRGCSLYKIHENIVNRLSRIGWRQSFPLLATAWESPVANSPSVHLWIPEKKDGEPVIEAIFDQSVIGEAAEFNGAAPSTLNKSGKNRISKDAIKMALLFQNLGYFGRCSMDAILIGDDQNSADIHWVECNGRWGGVSIPITVANRLIGDWSKRHIIVTEEAHLNGNPCDFAKALELLEDDLYVSSRSKSKAGVIFLSPGRIQDGSGFELMIMDTTKELACHRAKRVSEKLTNILLN